MAQTFDIRFARSGGFAAFFTAPQNSLGWRGGGLLSIDAQGVSIAVKRGIASLLARRSSQRIPAERITEVYREGEALRFEFATDDAARTILPVWARDHATAAQIVQLLPTSRTFEIEQDPSESREKKVAGLAWIVGTSVVLVLACLVLVMSRRPAVEAVVAPGTAEPPVAVPAAAPPEVPAPRASSGPEDDARAPSAADRTITPDEAQKLALAEAPVDWTTPPPPTDSASVERKARFARMGESPAAVEPEAEAFVPVEVPEIKLRGDETVVPIPRTTLAYGTARELLGVFETVAAGLGGNYRDERALFDRGRLDAPTFADRLDVLAKRWVELSDRLLQDRKFTDPALTGLRATLLAVVIQQRVFLTGYGAGLRSVDPARIERAFQELARAEELLARARQYLD